MTTSKFFQLGYNARGDFQSRDSYPRGLTAQQLVEWLQGWDYADMKADEE